MIFFRSLALKLFFLTSLFKVWKISLQDIFDTSAFQWQKNQLCWFEKKENSKFNYKVMMGILCWVIQLRRDQAWAAKKLSLEKQLQKQTFQKQANQGTNPSMTDGLFFLVSVLR